MEKLSRCLATLVLAFTAAGLILVLAAALDQFARLPFYHTLLAAALAADAATLVVAWRREGRLGAAFEAVRSRMGAVRPAWLRWPARHSTRAPRTAPVAPTPSAARQVRTPSTREINEALRKVHSVAWGFPNRRRTA